MFINPWSAQAVSDPFCTGQDVLLHAMAQGVEARIVLDAPVATVYHQLAANLVLPGRDHHLLLTAVPLTTGRTSLYRINALIPLPIWHVQLAMMMQQHVLIQDLPNQHVLWQQQQISGDLALFASQTELIGLDRTHTLVLYRVNIKPDPNFWLLRLLPHGLHTLISFLPWFTAASYAFNLQEHWPSSVPAPAACNDSAGWVRIRRRPTTVDTWLTWSYSVPLSQSQRRLIQLQRYHEFLPAVQKVTLRRQDLDLYSDWTLTDHLGPLTLHHHDQLHVRMNPGNWFYWGEDAQHHRLSGQWSMQATAPDQTWSQLFIHCAERSPDWVSGWLTYMPYPRSSAELLGGLLIMERSSLWLRSGDRPSQKRSTPPSARHKEWEP